MLLTLCFVYICISHLCMKLLDDRHFVLFMSEPLGQDQCVCVHLVAQSCPILATLQILCSLPGSSIHGLLQERTME